MIKRILLLLIFISFLSSCSNQTAKLLGGSDKELYDSIQSELSKKKTLGVFGGPRYTKIEDLILTLQVRYPYSELTREVSLINGDVSYKTKKFYEAIEDYKSFIEEQPNHPKINYATYMIARSYEKLMTATDKDMAPSVELIKLYENIDESLKNSDYITEMKKIYFKAKLFLLDRTIYIANFYIKKESYDSSLSRIIESEKVIESLISINPEAQYIKTFSTIKLSSDIDKNNLIEDYKNRFPKEKEFIENLEEIDN